MKVVNHKYFLITFTIVTYLILLVTLGFLIPSVGSFGLGFVIRLIIASIWVGIVGIIVLLYMYFKRNMKLACTYILGIILPLFCLSQFFPYFSYRYWSIFERDPDTIILELIVLSWLGIGTYLYKIHSRKQKQS